MSLHPLIERKPTHLAVGLAITTTIFVALVLAGILLELLPPDGWYADHSFMARLSWLLPYLADSLHGHWHEGAGMSLLARLEWVPSAVWADIANHFDIATGYQIRLLAIGTISALAGLVAGVTFGRLSSSRDALTHLSGRRLWRGYDAIDVARRFLRRAVKSYGRGLAIAPGLVLDRAREVQHIGLFGTTGSGKSTILRAVADQILARGDKLVLHDTKGDIVAGLPTDRFILLAPHDRRSHAWDVAKDVVTTQDARELAGRLVHDSRDPMWCGAAREILTGIVVSLQHRQPRSWSWRDLADATFLPVGELLALLQAHYSAAARYIEIDPDSGAPTRTTHGILITLWADVVAIVMPLAAAWGETPAKRRISLTAWIADDNGKLPATLILQRSARYSKLSSAWIGAAVECMASVAAGPDLPESQTRRIFFLLDEFAQLGKVKAFLQLLEVGRSKGIAAVLALQDIQQLFGIYGDAASKTILTLLGLKVIGKLPAGPSAAYVANELIGQREVTWQEQVCTTNSRDGSISTSSQSHRTTVPVITPHQLESRLGVGRHGVTALLLGLGDAFELSWPFKAWRQRRPASQPADWTAV